MASTPSSSTPSFSSSSSSSSPASDSFTPTEWTQQSMLSDVLQQKGLLIGLGVVIVAAFLAFRGRSPRPEEKAARRLVRDMRRVDDPDDARGLLSDNLPTIVRPALLIALQEIERQVHKGFDKLEHDLERL